jgi:hypothetical protein
MAMRFDAGNVYSKLMFYPNGDMHDARKQAWRLAKENNATVSAHACKLRIAA